MIKSMVLFNLMVKNELDHGGQIHHVTTWWYIDSTFKANEIYRVFSLFYKLIELTLILPVSIAFINEMTFSTMNIIKSKLRNKINDEWFNDLMICYNEWEMLKSLNDVDIIRTFTTSKTRKKNCRLQLNFLPRLSQNPESWLRHCFSSLVCYHFVAS
jgi:hypothetical protein